MADALTLARAQELIRVGWAVAELRGRVSFGPHDPGLLVGPVVPRVGHALPLGDERSSQERKIEAARLVSDLATPAGLAFDGAGTALEDGQHNPAASPCSMAARIAQLAIDVPEERSDAGWGPAWNAFSEALYRWDAQIQDTLAGGAYGESAAYQLGRGMAETTWALDPSSSEPVVGWTFLLGHERCVILTGLVDRLANVLDPLVVKAIEGSLRSWNTVAESAAWRSGSAPVVLRRQALVWRDLLLSGVDPRSMVKSKSWVTNFKTIWPIIRSVWFQVSGAAVSVAAISVGAWLLGRGHSATGPLGQLVAGLGAFGFSGSALSARAKTMANQLPGKVRDAVETDLVVEETTILPERPKGRDLTRQVPGRLAPPGSSSEPLSVLDVPTVKEASGRSGAPAKAADGAGALQPASA